MTLHQFLKTTVTTMKLDTLTHGARWGFAALVAVWIVSTAAVAPAAAQVFDGNLELTTQTQVDEFAFTAVTGDLVIQDDGSDPIMNLDGLNGLTTVGRHLSVLDNIWLIDVDGLSSLNSVGATMRFQNNTSLTDVDGLLSLSIVGRFFFTDNPSLTNLDGLSNLTQGGPGLSIGISGNDSLANVDGLLGLTSVKEDLVVIDNDSLTNVDGLRNITSVGRVLRFSGNPLLTDLDGLSNITSVGVQVPGLGFMHINNNDSLTNVDGLISLTSVGGSVFFSGNDLLTDVDGLINLTSVERNLTIVFNDSLMNVDGLSSLTSVGDDLIVEDNGLLMRFCGLYPLLATDGLAGGYFVSGNGDNPSEQDILNGGPCDPADTIGDLFAEGVITEGEATALLQLADNNLDGLAGILTGFVQSGILTPAEAQLLFVIATM
jgi:hypothetical protein